MKYRKEFYLLLAHINPAIYDVISPMGPLKNISGGVSRDFSIGNYQTQGSVYGTDFSGDLKVWAKLSWKMKNLVADLRTIVIQARSAQDQGGTQKGAGSVLTQIIDDYCGNGIRFPFPPKPHGVGDEVTIEEKVGAAALFAQAAFAAEGTKLAGILGEGADKILDSAISSFGETAGKVTRGEFNGVAVTN